MAQKFDPKAVPVLLSPIIEEEKIITEGVSLAKAASEATVILASYDMGSFKKGYFYALVTFAAGVDGDVDIVFYAQIPGETGFMAIAYDTITVPKNTGSPYTKEITKVIDVEASTKVFKITAINKSTSGGANATLNKLSVAKLQ